MKETDLQKSLKKFEMLLNKYPDELSHLNKFKDFFRSFRCLPSSKGVTLPICELATILKKEKPQIFNFLKSDSKDTLFYIITNIEMDYQHAVTKINEFKRDDIQGGKIR